VALRAVTLQFGSAALRAFRQAAVDEFEVFDRWEWIVEMMQQLPPALIVRRLTEALLMVGHVSPPHEQHVLVFHLDTALKLVPEVARHRPDDLLSLGEMRPRIAYLHGV